MARDGGVQFQGTRNGLLVRFDDEGDFDRLKELLAEKLNTARKFFHGSAITLDVGSRVLTSEQLLEIEAMFTSRYGIRVLQVVNGLAAGEGPGEGGEAPSPGQAAAGGARPRGALPGAELSEGDTLLVRRTVRSGQRIAYDGNIVVLGDVNPGGELVASGDVLVMGALRGVVHAGARGNERAVVLAIRLQPTQLRIANVIGRAPDEQGNGSTLPEIARIRDGEIVIDPYTGANSLEKARG